MQKRVSEKVKKLDYDQNKIVWLDASPANNTWTIAVRKDIASAHNLKTLEDLGKWIDTGGDFKLAASAELSSARTPYRRLKMLTTSS
ncbi:Substrate binding domain of ABC-type glycine betaine transport system [Ewingella americana]|uniref:Substrate binding domain of ABC-type glycine betaine transport system n=1 Tax=Ewingella americana TaxID=41202 RepID=A0A377NDK7_9GAMM|nr:Substrate binding domain of ABC-type glycine betaine transport system [Ewingella americana]